MYALKTSHVFFILMASTKLKCLPLPEFSVVSFCKQPFMCFWSKVENEEKFTIENGVF